MHYPCPLKSRKVFWSFTDLKTGGYQSWRMFWAMLLQVAGRQRSADKEKTPGGSHGTPAKAQTAPLMQVEVGCFLPRRSAWLLVLSTSPWFRRDLGSSRSKWPGFALRETSQDQGGQESVTIGLALAAEVPSEWFKRQTLLLFSETFLLFGQVHQRTNFKKIFIPAMALKRMRRLLCKFCSRKTFGFPLLAGVGMIC